MFGSAGEIAAQGAWHFEVRNNSKRASGEGASGKRASVLVFGRADQSLHQIK
jgi:hypothetical protein